MRFKAPELPLLGGALLAFVLFAGGSPGIATAKDRLAAVSSDDPTLRLYSLLDTKLGGKLEDFYLLADTFSDPQNPNQSQQHVLKLEYDKSRAFGKLRIYVRTVDQLTPDQLKTYNTKEIYDFAESESEKFTKTDPGNFGRTGDVYFQPTSPGGPLGTATATPEVQSRYEHYVTQFVIPALEKKASGTS